MLRKITPLISHNTISLSRLFEFTYFLKIFYWKNENNEKETKNTFFWTKNTNYGQNIHFRMKNTKIWAIYAFFEKICAVPQNMWNMRIKIGLILKGGFWNEKEAQKTKICTIPSNMYLQLSSCPIHLNCLRN